MDERVERGMERRKSHLSRTCMTKNADKPKCASTARNILLAFSPKAGIFLPFIHLEDLIFANGMFRFPSSRCSTSGDEMLG